MRIYRWRYDPPSAKQFTVAWVHSKQFDEYRKAGAITFGANGRTRLRTDGVTVVYIVDDTCPDRGEFYEAPPGVADALLRRHAAKCVREAMRDVPLDDLGRLL